MDIDGNYVSQDLGELTKKWKDFYMSGVANIANIKIDGNTISSTDTDGDINLVPDGAGKVVITDIETKNEDFNLDTGTGRTKITRLITGYGNQSSISGAGNSGNIQATKDILVTGYVSIICEGGASGRTNSSIVSDSTATPSTDILKVSAQADASSAGGSSFSFFVKKDDYYKITTTTTTGLGTPTYNTYWRELEIGA
jgi:hypothetical protein